MSAARRGQLLVGAAIAASALLIGAYLAAGGTSYTVAKTQDPCKHRPWRNPQGLAQIAEQFSLSALDGAACKLGVSREALAQALASSAARREFLDRYDISEAELAEAIRAGLLRAIGDAENAGALSPLLAAPLRETVRQIPLEEAIELVRDARSLLENAQGFLGPATGLLEQLLP